MYKTRGNQEEKLEYQPEDNVLWKLFTKDSTEVCASFMAVCYRRRLQAWLELSVCYHCHNQSNHHPPYNPLYTSKDGTECISLTPKVTYGRLYN